MDIIFIANIIFPIIDLKIHDFLTKFNYHGAAAVRVTPHPQISQDAISTQIISGALAIFMGIAAILRIASNMPKKLTEAALNYAGHCPETMLKGQVHRHKLPAPVISATEYSCLMKRIGQLEEKVSIISMKPASMPTDKEEKLNTAVSRVGALEAELMATKKVRHK